jgi:hypothetical protein
MHIPDRDRVNGAPGFDLAFLSIDCSSNQNMPVRLHAYGVTATGCNDALRDQQ